LRITEVKSYIVYAEWRNWIFVKVETDQGIHGVGEATLEGKEHAVTGAIQDLAYYLEGKDPREIELHLRNMYRDPFWRGGVVLNTAISAIEIALWDILGKHLGQPVYRLLGGKLRDRVRAYANGWTLAPQSPASTPSWPERWWPGGIRRSSGIRSAVRTWKWAGRIWSLRSNASAK